MGRFRMGRGRGRGGEGEEKGRGRGRRKGVGVGEREGKREGGKGGREGGEGLLPIFMSGGCATKEATKQLRNSATCGGKFCHNFHSSGRFS